MKSTLGAILLTGCLVLQTGGLRAEALKDLPKWKLGDRECVPDAIEKLVGETALDRRAAIEDALIAVAGSAQATPESRRYACWMLQRIGTKKCVPVLGGLLPDKDLSHPARLALQRMVDSPEAGQALKDALGKASDALKVGIIASLAERRDEGVAPVLQGHVSDANAEVASAAFAALGKFGGAEILKFLKGTKAAGTVAAARIDALLICARGLDGPQAADIYNAIYTEEKSDAYRAGALTGLVRTDEKKAAGIILDLIRGKDSYLRRVAVGCVANEKSVELTKAVAGALKDLPAESRANLVDLLAARGDRAAVDGLAGCLQDPDRGVRDTALLAVAALGDGRHVPFLLKAVNDDATGEAVLAGLAGMTAANTDEALVAALKDAALVVPALKAITRRDCRAAVPELMRLAKTGEGVVRSGAWTALSTTASAADIDAMMAALLEIKDETLRTTASNAVKNACSLSADKQTCFEAVLTYYARADLDTKEFILDFASVAGSPKALALVRSALKPDDQRLYDKAVRSLCAWPDSSAVADLLRLAQNGSDEKTRLVALRGYLTVAEREKDDKTKVKFYTDVRGLVKRADEKKLLASKLRSVPDVAAIGMLTEYVGDAEVCQEASAAALDLTKAMRGAHKPELKALLEKIIVTCKDNEIVNRAKSALTEINR